MRFECSAVLSRVLRPGAFYPEARHLPSREKNQRLKTKGSRSVPVTAFTRQVDYPAAPFAQKVFRFSLTPTFLRNRILLRFRRLRRDSRSLVRAQFLEHLGSATSAKRAVRPRFLFLRSPGTYPSLQRTGLHAQDRS